MTEVDIPRWAELSPRAPKAHQEAWKRAWSQSPRPQGRTPGHSQNLRIARMLEALTKDPQAPEDLVLESITAHVTEGRGAPDGPLPRGNLILTCLDRGLWRPSWFPASLAAFQESERDFGKLERRSLGFRLLEEKRCPLELRPLVLALPLLSRSNGTSQEIRNCLNHLLEARDVDRDIRLALLRLLRRPGWLLVRPESLRNLADVDPGILESLRRSKPVNLPISAACLVALEELRQEEDLEDAEDHPFLTRLAGNDS